MNYELRHTLASQATESARAAFIRRTYGHLAAAILAFVGIEAVLLRLPGIDRVIWTMFGGGGLMWLVVVFAFMGVATLANYWAQSDTSRGLQYAGLALYTVAEAVIFLPLLYIAERHFPNAIPTAAILTLAVFAGLTLTVFITQKDFSYLRPILTVGSLLAIAFIFAGCFFGFTGGLFFCLGMVALISGYILFYTSAVLHHYRTDQYVAASLALFASIATLFWYILQIVMSSSRN